jgi:APA family basic amino acid/polyamine antiporter
MPATPPSSLNSAAPQLVRTMGLFSLVVYGVGDMIGSGIYATVGKAAGSMGNAVWLAFVVSMVAAILTGLSYASLSSRYPRAAGAAFVTNHAYGFPYLSYLIGLLVTASGLTSMAASTNAFTNTLHEIVGGPWIVLALGFLGFMTAVNFYGLKQSMLTNLACTAVEVGGLLFIVAIGARYWGSVDYLEVPQVADAQGQIVDGSIGISMLLSGAVLTFFSFIGFEDMLNVAEEVKEPERTMPWGIVFALAVATLLYISVAVTAVSVVDYRELAQAPAPLSAICAKAAPWLPKQTFDYITMFAVANTVLINYIMGSRMLYGMARQGLLPAVLGRVHGTRNTPHIAIGTLLVLVLILALSGGEDAVKQLASSTALLLLFSFMVVNSALVVLKLRPGEPHGQFEVPVIIPILGILVNLTLIGSRLWSGEGGTRAPLIAGAIVVIVTILFFVLRPKNITDESLAALEE